MVSENVKEIIPKIQQFLIDQPVEKAWLFGSSSRGEERPDSDVDILVQYDKDCQISLLTISRMIVQICGLSGIRLPHAICPGIC